MEQNNTHAPGKGKRLAGGLLKLGFYAALALMSCGTLLLALYTFFVRGIR